MSAKHHDQFSIYGAWRIDLTLSCGHVVAVAGPYSRIHSHCWHCTLPADMAALTRRITA